MHRYPHTTLFSNPHRIVVLSGPHVQVLDTQSGHILRSTTNLAREDEDVIIKSGPIRCSGVSKDGRYLATAADDKQLKMWDLESLTLLSARALPKKPTSIEFSGNMDVLVSDKFGDVFRYPFHPNNKVVEEKSACNPLASHQNASNGELILGHASLLTSCLLTPDEKFIITADRDEHIRVSWYPEGYVIESYCLGHKKFVSAIHIPTVSPSTLISGGGDLELKVWAWMTGRLQRNIAVFPAVEPFIRVTARPSEGSDEPSNTTAVVFVVRKISSFFSEDEIHIVFSVVGATAIFEFILAGTDDQPEIRHHDFGKPVIDFTICGEGTMIWVLLDTDFPVVSDVANECPGKLVQVVRWSIDQFIDAGSSVLLDSLNTTCSLPATAQDLKALDLYSDLSSLPKSIEGEQPNSTGEDASIAVGPTKRALGRLKHKRAQDQLHHEKVLDGRDVCGSNTKKMKAVSDNKDLRDMYSTVSHNA